MIFTLSWLREILPDLPDMDSGSLTAILKPLDIHAEKAGPDAISFQGPENRPDLHSLLGIARAIAAVLGLHLQPLADSVTELNNSSIFEHLDVDVYSESCCRFSARLALNCRMGPSPQWVQKRLMGAGITSRCNLLDAAALTMLETGIPVMVMDRRNLPGGSLLVRDSLPGESFSAAGKKICPEAYSVPLLCDENYEILSLCAGINEDLPGDCRDVYLFCGIYDRAVMKALSSETENFYELKQHCLGLDPMGALPAIQRACHLIEVLADAKITEGIQDNLCYVPNPRSLPLEQPLSKALLAALETLGFVFLENEVTLPSFREDIKTPEDLRMQIQSLKDAMDLYHSL